ncbi:MAG: hypothetical protein K2N58_01260 [Treponemataceae bacterium]|nr:hypothetical protein [Treponemataceae bacterium]
MSYDVMIQSKVKKISPVFFDELNHFLDYLVFKSESEPAQSEELSAAQKSYENLLHYAGQISIGEDLKKELSESRTERYESVG